MTMPLYHPDLSLSSPAIYARVSTDAQAEKGRSIETQVEACRDLAAVPAVEYIDDGYSGAYLERPALSRLRDALSDGLHDAVICYTPDRLSRNLAHQLILADEIKRAKASLLFVQGAFDDSPEGRMFFQMQGAFAEYEREKIKERMTRGIRAKLRAGKPFCDAHVYGYAFQGGEYIINETEAEIVRRIFRQFADCAGGIRTIAAQLTADGVPTPKGGARWAASSLRKMLAREMYTGKYYSCKRQYHEEGLHVAVTPRPRDEWIAMECPAIIDAETFAAAQMRLEKNRAQRKGERHGNYLLQGIAYCAKCGKRLHVVNNGFERYYGCRELCGARYAKTRLVDNAVWQIIERITASPAALERYVANNTPKEDATQAREQRKAKARKKKIQAERQAVMRWFSDGLLDHATATAKLESLKREAETIEAILRTPTKSPDLKLDADEICKAVAAATVDFAARRRIVQRYVRAVHLIRTDTERYTDDIKLDIRISFYPPRFFAS